jgi:type VI secretion system protein VasG
MLKKEGDRSEVDKAYKAFKTLQETNAYVYENVSAEQISEVIASWTGIPLGNMKQEQAKSMSEFATEIKKRIIGQDESIDYISNFLQVSMAGLKKESTPEGVFLLVGPSGVGKTETAIAISELLFGGQSFMTTINMSEFQEKHTVSRLLGSPPGYVGYGEGGQLTDPVRIKPYSVILLDEIEKAHPDILNTFYQIFDKGIANDGEGREINFKNTVIIMTSNLATEEITNLCSGNENIEMESIREQITPALTKYLKPALLGRMTVIPYKNLSLEALSKIASLKLESIEKQLLSQGIELIYDEALLEQIVSLSNATETGARNLEMIINNTLMPKLSSAILESRVENQQIEKMTMSLDVEKNVNVEVEYQ